MDDNGEAHPEDAEPVELADGESKEINAELQTGGEIHGVVVDIKTGDPIEGVGVCAQLVGYFQTGEVSYCDRSDAAGEFTVRNLGTGQYRLEFQTEGDVNYIEEQLPAPPSSFPLTAGNQINVEAFLLPGVQIEGTLTEMGTGTPIVGLLPPYSAPAVCALDPATQARVKCATVESGGHYSIAGLPAGAYAVSFAVDTVEGGLDLYPDGYVRRYWEEVPTFEEATPLAGTAGEVIDEIDAVLSKGEEVFPNCEVPSACPQPPPPGEAARPGNTIVPPVTAPPPVRPISDAPVHKGFRSGAQQRRARARAMREGQPEAQAPSAPRQGPPALNGHDAGR